MASKKSKTLCELANRPYTFVEVWKRLGPLYEHGMFSEPCPDVLQAFDFLASVGGTASVRDLIYAKPDYAIDPTLLFQIENFFDKNELRDWSDALRRELPELCKRRCEWCSDETFCDDCQCEQFEEMLASRKFRKLIGGKPNGKRR